MKNLIFSMLFPILLFSQETETFNFNEYFYIEAPCSEFLYSDGWIAKVIKNQIIYTGDMNDPQILDSTATEIIWFHPELKDLHISTFYVHNDDFVYILGSTIWPVLDNSIINMFMFPLYIGHSETILGRVYSTMLTDVIKFEVLYTRESDTEIKMQVRWMNSIEVIYEYIMILRKGMGVIKGHNIFVSNLELEPHELKKMGLCK